MMHDAVVSDASIVVMAVSIALIITLQLVLFLIIDFLRIYFLRKLPIYAITL